VLLTLGLRDRYFNYGYLMASANLSDLYGTGATPIALLVGLLVPDSVTDHQVDRLLRGIQSCCATHHVPVVGGDTKRSDRLQGYGTAVGRAKSVVHLFTRDRAKVGQRICLSGEVGDFNAATYLLSSGQCPPEWQKQARRAITRPKLRRQLSLRLAEATLATGGIDISDGLGMDLWRLAAASNVSLVIQDDALPVGELAIKAAAKLRIDPLAFVFATGGDWQFAFTCDEAHVAECARIGAVPIGWVEHGSGCLLRREDGMLPLPRFGHSDDRSLEFGDEVRLGIQVFVNGT
jgi:thiamine-monophosphate kinase